MALMSRIGDCPKNLLANCFCNFGKKKFKGDCCSKYSKNNKFNTDCKLQQTFADFSRPSFVFSLSLSARMPRSLSYSCYFCDMCYSVFLDSKKNSSEGWLIPLVRFLRNLRLSRGPSWPFLCYSCYSCHVCMLY